MLQYQEMPTTVQIETLVLGAVLKQSGGGDLYLWSIGRRKHGLQTCEGSAASVNLVTLHDHLCALDNTDWVIPKSSVVDESGALT